MAERDGFKQFEFADTSARRRLNVPWKWLLLLAVLGGIGAYAWLYERDRVTGALDAALPEAMLPEAVRPAPPDAAPATIYRWRAADGSWTLSDRKPPAGTAYEVVR